MAHGTANAKKVMEMLRNGELNDVHFVEIMACPGGCLGGGGQPIPTSSEIRMKRAQAIYEEDASLCTENLMRILTLNISMKISSLKVPAANYRINCCIPIIQKEASLFHK